MQPIFPRILHNFTILLWGILSKNSENDYF